MSIIDASTHLSRRDRPTHSPVGATEPRSTNKRILVAAKSRSKDTQQKYPRQHVCINETYKIQSNADVQTRARRPFVLPTRASTVEKIRPSDRKTRSGVRPVTAGRLPYPSGRGFQDFEIAASRKKGVVAGPTDAIADRDRRIIRDDGRV